MMNSERDAERIYQKKNAAQIKIKITNIDAEWNCIWLLSLVYVQKHKTMALVQWHECCDPDNESTSSKLCDSVSAVEFSVCNSSFIHRNDGSESSAPFWMHGISFATRWHTRQTE